MKKTATKRTAQSPARTRRPRAAAKPRAVTKDIRSLISEVRDLRTLRTKYDALVREHHGLLGALRELSSELATGARSAWNDYRHGAPAGGTRQRVRAPSSAVDGMTAKLLASLPSAWSTKEQICKAAGLDPRAANSAFRRLVLGYKRDGKSVAAALESNGKRGTEGRYRKR
jgi:hypothetical protein